MTENEDAAKEWAKRVSDELVRIAKENHGQLIMAETVVANCTFWVRLLSDNYPDLGDYVAALVSQTGLRVMRVDSPPGGMVH